jgi:hypothetical protein
MGHLSRRSALLGLDTFAPVYLCPSRPQGLLGQSANGPVCIDSRLVPMTTPINLESFERRLKAFYELRAVELREDDPEALLRLRKAIKIAAPR